MIIYFFNIFSLLLWGYIYRKSIYKENMKKILIIIIVFQFTLLQGLRAESIGMDTAKYIDYYEYLRDSRITVIDLFTNPPFNFEIGYMLLMYFCGMAGVSAQAFIFVISLIINALLGWFIYKNSRDFIMSFWIFIGIEFFSLSFTMLRQMIAILLVANSFQFMKERKIKQYLLMILIAASFHKTAFVFLPAYLLNFMYPIVRKLKSRLSTFYVYKIVGILFSYFLVLFVFPKIIIFVLNLFYGYYIFTASSLGTLFFIMAGLLGSLLLYEMLYNDNSYEMFVYQSFIYVASLFQLATVIVNHVYRGAYYYYFFTCISLPYVIAQLRDKKGKMIFCLAVYVATLMQYVLFSMDIYNLVPYQLSGF